MLANKFSYYCIYIIFISSIIGCTNEKIKVEPENQFPEAISKIVAKGCARIGCHTTRGAGNAGGLDFSTWDKMFEGGVNGSPVIPYSSEFSYLMSFINTYADLGNSLQPTMPIGAPPLTRDEVILFKNWIDNGAPDKNGNVKFSSDASSRSKIYVVNQGCDRVSVIDAASKVVMRLVKVGINDQVIESPHAIKVSPDGKYWYVIFLNAQVIQKFNADTDEWIANISLGPLIGQWNTISFFNNSNKMIVADLLFNNLLVLVDLDNYTSEILPVSLLSPHGTAITPDDRYLYVTSNRNGSNIIYKIDMAAQAYTVQEILLEAPLVGLNLNPHEVYIAPGGDKYFVTCQASNEVRVFDLSNDQLLAIIPVGTKPLEMAFSLSKPYAFVTCEEDAQFGTGKKGSVYVINYNDLTIVGNPISVFPGYQPHGVAVDDANGLVYVANRNIDPNGPAPHHSSSCGGRNGSVIAIDMNTLQLFRKSLQDDFNTSFTYKMELLTDPYFISVRK